MSDDSPCDEISIPRAGADFNVLRVPAATAVSCYWGRDTAGSCLFIVELKGNHIEQYRQNVVTVRGLRVDLRSGVNEGQQRLVLALEQQVDRDLFSGLCRSLASALENATDSASSLAVCLRHLRRWKTFLSRRGHHLSAEEVRGLFGEILFVSELLDLGMPEASALDAWVGPEGSQQDFMLGNTAVEIKALSGGERNAVRISSEDQMESLKDSLFLRMYRLSGMSGEAPDARSLNALVHEVHDRLDAGGTGNIFDSKLAAQGYTPLPDYDQPRFAVSEIRTFTVGEGFPRLVRSQLPAGLARVSYDIELEAIEAFERDNSTAFEGL